MGNLTQEQRAWATHPVFGGGGGGSTGGGSAAQPALSKTPPDDVLRRQGDGGIYWEPNPSPATWGSRQSAAPDDWVKGFLVYYDLAPPAPGAGNTPDACLFNSEATTIDRVVTTVNAQAALASYGPSTSAKAIAKKICADRGAGQKQGSSLADKIASGDIKAIQSAVDGLAKMDMPALLDALEKLREAGDLRRLALMQTKPRLTVGILSVEKELDDKWKDLMGKLSDDDQRAIRRHVYGRLVAGDAAGDDDGGKDVQDFVDSIGDLLKKKDDLKQKQRALSQMDMRNILNVVAKLKQARTLDPFINVWENMPKRVGAAVLTINEDFAGQWEDVVAQLNDDDQQAILERSPADVKPKLSDDKPKDKKKQNAGWSNQFSGALQYAGHWTISDAKKVKKITPNNPPYDWTMQAQVAANYAGHPEDASGPEFSALVQFGYDVTTNQITVLAGLQGAMVQVWEKGVKMQLQESLQALGGNVTDASSFNSINQQFQMQVGIQYLVQLGPVWVGLQVAGGVTYTQNSPIDFPMGASLVLQW